MSSLTELSLWLNCILLLSQLITMQYIYIYHDGRANNSTGMVLLDLPNELLICIYALSRSNRRLHHLLNTYLYSHNIRRHRSRGLRWAARHNCQEGTVRTFLLKGADLEITETDSRTPLSLAAAYQHEPVVKLCSNAERIRMLKTGSSGHHCGGPQPKVTCR
jgi:hypothetical protein